MLHEEYPSVSVKRGSVFRFSLDCDGAHFLSFIEVSAVAGESVGIVVKREEVVGIVLKSSIVIFSNTVYLLHLLVDVSNLRIDG